jgi:hypothetical protein
MVPAASGSQVLQVLTKIRSHGHDSEERETVRTEIQTGEEREKPLSHLLTVFGPLFLKIRRGKNFSDDSGSVDGRVGVARSGSVLEETQQSRSLITAPCHNGERANALSI